MKKLLAALLLLLSLNVLAATQQPLPVDQAFQLSLMVKDRQTLVAQWKMAPGYFLYRERIHFIPTCPEATRLGKAWMPKGIKKSDVELGNYEVYAHDLKVIIPIIDSTENLMTLSIDYQGCSEAGYCYPPTKKVFRVNLAGAYLQATSALKLNLPPPQPAILSKQDKITALLNSEHTLWILLAFFGFGLLISLTPCVLPMIPILSSIIMGQKNLNRHHSFLLSLCYVIGMAVTYAIIGILFGLIGSNFQIVLQKPAVIIAFSLMVVAMALSMFGLYDLQLPSRFSARLQNISGTQQRGSYLGAFVMGILATLVVSPCVTAPLVGVLGFIGERGSMVLGGSALFMLGLGMGVPLLIIGTTGHIFFKTGPWMNRIKQLLGLIMLGVAIYMLSRLLPNTITMLLSILLSLASGIVLGALKSAHSLGDKFAKALGLLFCLYAVALSFSLIAGNTNPLHPWVSETPHNQALYFVPVKTVAEVAKQVAAANGKPVMLDFYADWCVACKVMDRTTFSNPEVQRQLQAFILLRADITANDEQDKALNSFYRVIAPPTIVFFNSAGENMPEQMLVGEVSATELSQHLKELK